MMPSTGPPTPQGVGGPTPPLVSRGSEEEGGKRLSVEGLPSPGRKGNSTSPARVEDEVSPPNWDGGERTKILEPPIHLDPATNFLTPFSEPPINLSVFRATNEKGHVFSHQ